MACVDYASCQRLVIPSEHTSTCFAQKFCQANVTGSGGASSEEVIIQREEACILLQIINELWRWG